MSTRVTTLEDAPPGTTGTDNTARQKADAAQAKADANETAITALNTDLDTAEAAITTLDHDLNDTEADVETLETKVAALENAGPPDVSEQDIQNAINALPSNKANKFQQKYVQAASQDAVDVNQIATRMNDMVSQTHNLIGIAGNEFTIEVTPANTRLPTDLDAETPFITKWEGNIDILATGAGPQSYLTIIQKVTHFVGLPHEFSNEREIHERMLATFDIAIPLSMFDSATPLKQTVLDRATMPDFAYKLELIFRLYSDTARTTAKNFNLLTSFNVSFNRAGVLYYQANKPIGPPVAIKGDAR